MTFEDTFTLWCRVFHLVGRLVWPSNEPGQQALAAFWPWHVTSFSPSKGQHSYTSMMASHIAWWGPPHRLGFSRACLEGLQHPADERSKRCRAACGRCRLLPLPLMLHARVLREVLQQLGRGLRARAAIRAARVAWQQQDARKRADVVHLHDHVAQK